MKLSPRLRHRILAFTLVELLVVITIIALLIGLAFPAYTSAINRAKSISCTANLRSIGTAVSLAATDNNNTYPEIDQAATPIYTPQGPNLVTALGPYGININSIQCPVDILSGSSSSFKLYGSSYQWNPVFDDEIVGQAVIYPNAQTPIPVNSSRVRLCTDFLAIHHNKVNAVYGDGHVSNH